MHIRIQLIIIAIVIIALIALINMIRKNKLELKYALLWFALGIGVFIFACVPGLMNLLAELMGISSPINMLFFIGFCFSLIIIFSLSVAVSRASNRMKKLTQEVALLKKEIKEKNGQAE